MTLPASSGSSGVRDMGFDPLAYAFGEKGSGYPAGRDLVSYLMGKNAAGGAYHEFTGSIIRFLASKAAPIRSIIASILPVQEGSGDPSPENVRPISGWTAANVYRTGVNVWDEEWERGRYNATTGQKTPNATAMRCKNPIPVKPGAQYYVAAPYGMFIIGFDASGNCISLLTNDSGSTSTANKTITMPSNCYAVVWYSDAYTADYDNNISINYPATDTSYHSYQGTTIPITFPTPPGTVYGGTVSVDEDGKVKLTATMASVDLGTLTPNKTVSNYFAYHVLCPTNGTVICSHYPTGGAGISAASAPDMSIFTSASVGTYYPVLIKDSAKADYTVEQMRTAMSDVQLVYDLAEPVEYDLADVTVLSTLQGVNTMWADTGDITVTARGTEIPEPELNAQQSLNLLLGGRYVNNGGADEPSDEEALQIIMGGNNR